ncbi:MAG: YgiQ family radical SAM protein, partial [Candidatus Omnitrophota bacterium]
DAYVDHPAYGTAVIGRVLESYGYKVGVIPQPDWRGTEDFTRLGRPRLFFGITAGNTDSMIANYTANKKPRQSDEYSAGDKAGSRPDRAAIVYANRVRQAFKDVPIVLGGMEASLRRLSHYDYWDNRVRRSILLDARADVLVYGMGERQVVEIAQGLEQGRLIQELDIRGTVVARREKREIENSITIPSFEETAQDKNKFNEAFTIMYANMSPETAKTIVQPHQEQFVLQRPPAWPFSPAELDTIYDLPYLRGWHPIYAAQGGVRGLETVRFSLTSHRGCCGECSFCALYAHQGRIIQSRSARSIIREAELLAQGSDFKGTITDVGGPTANLYATQCTLWKRANFCLKKKCLIPQKCAGLRLGYEQSIELYRQLRKIPRVKHVFIGSGVRYDLLTDRYAEKYLEEICAHHVSGMLKVAPEHSSDKVLRLMNKPAFSVYETFARKFQTTVRRLKKDYYLINYFLSAHPGSTLRETLQLAVYLAQKKIRPQQIQDFIPSPMTLSAGIYWTGRDPWTSKEVYVPKTFRERKMQRALIQYYQPAKRKLVYQALRLLGAVHLAAQLFGARASGKNKRRRRN